MSKDITNNFSVLNADLPESVDNALKKSYRFAFQKCRSNII